MFTLSVDNYEARVANSKSNYKKQMLLGKNLKKKEAKFQSSMTQCLWHVSKYTMQGNSSSETYLMSVHRLAYTMSRQPRVIEMGKKMEEKMDFLEKCIV